MKTIKSPYLGLRHVEARDPHVQLFQLRNALNAHRDRLIHRMINDLPRYLYCRFETTASTRQLEELKGKLIALTTQNVDLDRYHEIVDHFRRRSKIEIRNQIFFDEIDALIEWNFDRQQLKIAS